MRHRILAVAPHYVPGYRAGGPVRSLQQLVEATCGDFEWWIVTSDRDLRDVAPYPGIKHGCWVEVGGARVRYLSPTEGSPRSWWRLLHQNNHEALYLNSLFSPRFSVAPLVAARMFRGSEAPVLLAPRGETSTDALRLKAWKKRPYVHLAHHLYADVHWHASTSSEAADIRRLLAPPEARLHVARNLTPPPPPPPPRSHEGHPLRICFLSRIARMKNLEYVLRVAARLRTPTALTIAGPCEDPVYWQECEKLAATLPTWVTVRQQGPVEPTQVPALLANHDVLFVPSKGENFGHVFFDALAAGTPVLVSDRTPWRGLVAKGVGWDLPLEDEDAFVAALETLAAQTSDARQARSERCHALACEVATDRGALDAHRTMLMRVIGLTPDAPEVHDAP